MLSKRIVFYCLFAIFVSMYNVHCTCIALINTVYFIYIFFKIAVITIFNLTILSIIYIEELQLYPANS